MEDSVPIFHHPPPVRLLEGTLSPLALRDAFTPAPNTLTAEGGGATRSIKFSKISANPTKRKGSVALRPQAHDSHQRTVGRNHPRQAGISAGDLICRHTASVHGKPGFRLRTQTPAERLKNYMIGAVWEEDSVTSTSL